MSSKPFALRAWCKLACALSISIPLLGANTGSITRLKVDTDADVVNLFDGLAGGELESRVVARNQFKANIFVTNTTDEVLTVKVPEAVAAVHVLKQNNGFFQNAQNGFFQQGQNQQNQTNLGDVLGQGTGQDLGGQVGAANNDPFGGIFSIPPMKTVKLAFNSVCLDHGKPNPRSTMNYMLIPIEMHSKNRELHALLKGTKADKVNRLTLQAAAWHLANDISWKKLESKRHSELAVISDPYFSRKQIELAKALVERAKKSAKSAPKTSTTSEPVERRR